MAAVMAARLEEVSVYPVRIDWKRLFDELRLFGWTPYKVALTLCVDPPVAYGWAKGNEPRHAYGAALIVLHRHVCGDEYSGKLNKDSAGRL